MIHLNPLRFMYIDFIIQLENNVIEIDLPKENGEHSKIDG